MSKTTTLPNSHFSRIMQQLRVPKISAATVAENRNFRESEILGAANLIARESGLQSVTFGEIAKRTGMSRTSVYAYFDSSADLIADVLIDELFEMNELLKARVSSASSPTEAVVAWMQASLEYVNDGRHEFLKSAATVQLPPARRAQMLQLHREMILPLSDSLVAMGIQDARVVAMQISGVVDVAVRRITSGGDLTSEIATAKKFILNGLSAFTS